MAHQCGFLAGLYVTGSVGIAARSVGMSRASVYRLRARAEAVEFAWAWDHVLTPPGAGLHTRPRPDFRKVTDLALSARLDCGLVRPLIYRGRMFAIQEKHDDSALFRLLRRHDAMLRKAGREQSNG